MAADSGEYGAGKLVMVGAVAFVGVSLLTGWIQIVAGSLLGMLALAVATGRYLRWHSTSPLQDEQAGQRTPDATKMAGREGPWPAPAGVDSRPRAMDLATPATADTVCDLFSRKSDGVSVPAAPSVIPTPPTKAPRFRPTATSG